MTLRDRLIVASLLLLLLPRPADAQRASIDGRIRGRVLAEGTDSVLADAWVALLDGERQLRATSRTDSAGRFEFGGIRPGPFAFRVARFGYADTTTPYWRVEGGEELEVIVRLDEVATLLAPLEITASTRSASPLLQSFYARMDRGIGGRFLGREQIERRNAMVISDLLTDVPGLRFEGGSGVDERYAVFSRALGRCPAEVFVDGILASRGAPIPLNDIASPLALEGIEVYSGLSAIPPEYLTPNSRCGVIALWTRRGG